jgi:hypothetical protein
MTADQIDAKVVSRIHKLLALARDGGATEHEANAAMQMAQEQMLKYNLSMATIEATGSGASEGRTKDKADKNLMYPWKRELLRAIAAVNFVHVELLDKRTKSGQYIGAGYELIGRVVERRRRCRTMFEYLLQTIERLVRRGSRPVPAGSLYALLAFIPSRREPASAGSPAGAAREADGGTGTRGARAAGCGCASRFADPQCARRRHGRL